MDSLTKSRIEEKIKMMKKQLESVYKSTNNHAQKQRVSRQLASLEKDFKRLQEGSFSEEEENKYLTEKDRQLSTEEEPESVARSLEDYEELSRVPIEQAHPYSTEQDINELYSMLQYLENEFWGALSDYQLKLDFNLSQKRDVILNSFGMLQVSFKNYFEVLNDLNSGHARGDYAAKLRNMLSKQHMELLFKTGDFAKSLLDILETMLDDYRDGGTAIVNTEHVLQFDELHGDRILEGLTVVEALQRLRVFLGEMLEYLNIPELGKYRNDSL